MQRITERQLKGSIERLNIITGNPVEPYISNPETKRYEPQAGCYHLDIAYGGYRLVRMSSKTGCSGVSDITGRGTKRELYEQIHAMINILYNEGVAK